MIIIVFIQRIIWKIEEENILNQKITKKYTEIIIFTNEYTRYFDDSQSNSAVERFIGSEY